MFTLSVLPPRRSEERHFQRYVHNEAALVEDGHCVSHLYRKAADFSRRFVQGCTTVALGHQNVVTTQPAPRHVSHKHLWRWKENRAAWTMFSTFEAPRSGASSNGVGIHVYLRRLRPVILDGICGDVFKWSAALLRDGDIKARRQHQRNLLRDSSGTNTLFSTQIWPGSNSTQTCLDKL